MKHFCILLSTLTALGLQAIAADNSPSLRLPPYTQTSLTNGLTLLLMEQHEVPLVSVSILVQAGSSLDPLGKEGTASLTAELMRRGTKKRSPEQVSEELDFIGAHLDFSASPDFVQGSAEFLKKDAAKALELLADVLRNPKFPGKEVANRVRANIDEIKQAKDEPQSVLGLYFDAFLFDAHPYGRPASGEEQTLAKIGRSDLAKFHEQWYGPATTTIAVVGDFDTKVMERAILMHFDDWKSKAAPPKEGLPVPAEVRGKKLLLIDKPDATQTFFMIGNVGVSRTDPDRVAIDAANTAFGGRFTSMLNNALRVEAGLTYGARSRFNMSKVPGEFAISTYTKNASTVQAMDMTLDLLKTLHRDGLTPAQLDSVKAYLKGQFPPRIETPDQLASLLTQLSFYGLDEKEVNDRFVQIDALTADDVKSAIRKHFPLENLVYVLIGKASEIGDAVKKYAPKMETRSITEPGFRSAATRK